MRMLPDGSFTMTNQPIASIIQSASPDEVREVVGLPDWARTERYDVMAKAPAGSTRAQSRAMMQQMFAERMKFAGHVEQQERSTFALVLARRDGRLGPELKPSTLDCTRPGLRTAPPQPGTMGCGSYMTGGMMMGGHMAMAQLAQTLGGLAGGLVNDRTGLDGFYELTLKYAPRTGPGPAATGTSPDDPPDVFTALQEQLGLKLQPEKSTVPVLVIDHLERPTEN
jgi:uncharacterized protein (TIGR03435 family)